MATGSCDNLLLATYLSMKTKTIVAPAMDLDMYAHPTVLRNLKQIESDGVQLIPAESGQLASGLEGEGRMAEPETIFQVLLNNYSSLKNDFEGKNVLITAGPTYEEIDPVRFIGNHSSGKMGYAIAEAFLNQGAHVTLITGPTKLELQHKNLELIPIKSANELLANVQKYWNEAEIGVFSAAVADYRPKEKSPEKIKKSEDVMTIELVKNPDVLKWAGENKNERQTLIGFALETENLEENAKAKLKSKHLNMIVMNTMKDIGAGFGVDTNKISILDNYNNFKTFELKSKSEVAQDILTYLKNYNS